MENHKIIKLFLILTFMNGCIPTTNFPEIILQENISPSPTIDQKNPHNVFLSTTSTPLPQTSIDQYTGTPSEVRPSSTFIPNTAPSVLITPSPTATQSQSFLGGGTYVPIVADVPVDVNIDTSTN